MRNYERGKIRNRCESGSVPIFPQFSITSNILKYPLPSIFPSSPLFYNFQYFPEISEILLFYQNIIKTWPIISYYTVYFSYFSKNTTVLYSDYIDFIFGEQFILKLKIQLFYYIQVISLTVYFQLFPT